MHAIVLVFIAVFYDNSMCYTFLFTFEVQLGRRPNAPQALVQVNLNKVKLIISPGHEIISLI